MKFIVAIATFKRPEGLQSLFSSLFSQSYEMNFDILVCDNSPDNLSAESICIEANKFFSKGTVYYEQVFERGISQVRNRMLDFSFARNEYDAVIMLDDDEVAHTDWLSNLIEFYLQNNYDVVGGHVKGILPDNRPAWANGLAIYWDNQCNSGPVDLIEGTGNVLITRSVVQKENSRFDLSFSLTGGGDREFFYRLKKCSGATFGLCAEAIVQEPIPNNRLTFDWAVKRSFRIGLADMRISMKHERSIRYWSMYVVKSNIALVIGAVYGLFFFAGNKKSITGILLLARQIGKYCAVLGLRYLPYKKTDGR